MFDSKEFTYGRSGTAPSQKPKTSVYPRSRPKTRSGVSNDGGASDLADLNLALKMDNQLNIVNDEEALENYQSAIDSWESDLMMRHYSASSNSRKNSSKVTSSRSNSAAYKSSDPVSAAYTSQFRRSTPSSNSSTPRTRVKTSRTDEIKAVYGVSRESNSSSLPGQRKPRYSDSVPSSFSRKSTHSPTTSRPPSASTSTNVHNGRASPRSMKRSTRSENVNDNTTMSQSDHFQESAPYAYLPPRPNSSVTKRPEGDSTSKGMSFKRQHQLRVVTAPSTENRDLSSGAVDLSMNKNEKVSSASPTPPQSKHSTERPKSRKLYLGTGYGVGGGETMSAMLGYQTQDETLPINAKVPSSTSGTRRSPSNQSPSSDHCTSNSDLILRGCDLNGAHNEQQNPMIHRTSSFGGFTSKSLSAPWHGENLDDRPPSRQRSAFPTHLVSNSKGQVVVDSKRRVQPAGTLNSGGNIARSSDAYASKDCNEKATEESNTNVRKGSGGDIMGGNTTLARPPSRQRLNAQHLWSECEGGSRDDDRAPTPQYSSDDDNAATDHSPVSTSVPISSKMSFDQSYGGTSNNLNNILSRSPSPQIALGPMYDPSADGFTQLECRGNTAPPFKIRYNTSPSASNGFNKKPQSAVSKSSKYRVPSTDDYEMNEDMVESYSTSKHHGDLLIDSSSPSPEQMEIYNAWKSNTSSPTSQQQAMHMIRSKSGNVTHKDKDECRRAMGRSSSTSSALPPNTSPTSQRKFSKEPMNRVFLSDRGSNGDLAITSPSASPVSSRYRNRNLACNLDDISYADEELTEMGSNCSENDFENDVNKFGGELSQSIMLESSLGQDFLNLFAPCD